MRGRILACALAAALLLPASARGASYCVATVAEKCTPAESVAEALTFAQSSPGPDTVLLGALQETGTYSDSGQPLTVIGGRGGPTRLSGELTLGDGSSATQLQLTGDLAVSGATALENVAIKGAVSVGCGAATVRHLTVTEAATVACAVAGDTATLALASSRVGTIEEGMRATVTTAYSSYGGAVERHPSDVVTGTPGFGPDGLRPAPASALVDAGDPAPLVVPTESMEDADDAARIADGDADGIARRDIGAFELHVPFTPPAGNLLVNGGAEQGLVGWAADTAGFEAARYGIGDYFPTAATGSALGGDVRFFAGGSAHQDVDLRHWAPEIDAGGAAAHVDALLGGFRADADRAAVRVDWLGPAGEALGSTPVLTAPTDLERGHAVTLAPRSLASSVPPLARTARVVLVGEKGPSGEYIDAYFDDVAFRLDAPAGPGQPPPPPPPGSHPPGEHPILRPFSGISVLTGASTVDSKARVRVTLGCASATVGRCSGVITLAAALRGGDPFARVGSARFDVLPGRTAVARVKVASALARRLRHSRSGRLLGRLYASSRDGQGAGRTQTSPFQLKRRKR